MKLGDNDGKEIANSFCPILAKLAEKWHFNLKTFWDLFLKFSQIKLQLAKIIFFYILQFYSLRYKYRSVIRSNRPAKFWDQMMEKAFFVCGSQISQLVHYLYIALLVLSLIFKMQSFFVKENYEIE